jgi:hypothetical protein
METCWFSIWRFQSGGSMLKRVKRYFQFCAAIAVLLVAVSAPTLNCMSLFYKMDMQQMDCCKKMAAGCDMGAAHDSCCQSSSDPYAANGTMASKTVQLSAPVLLSGLHLPVAPIDPLAASNEFIAQADADSPPFSPPADSTILRI